MSRKAALLAGVFLCSCVIQGADFSENAGPGSGERGQLLFAGDILLSRQVEVQMSTTGGFPWALTSPKFKNASLVFGNLEGAVGEGSQCSRADGSRSPCFAIKSHRISLLSRAGFHALSVSNNHAGDLGPAGREATREALISEGLRPVSFERGPVFFRVAGHVIAIMALNLVPGRDGVSQRVPSHEVRQQLRLARSLSSAVVVSVHWGEELLDWPSVEQRQAASWLIENGASVIAGHHPHVVQAPECIGGRPVFFSLGNHLFDQKYPATKEGLLARCETAGGFLTCDALATRTQSGSFYPELAGDVPALPALGCRVPLNEPLKIGDTVLLPMAKADASALVLEGLRDGHVVFRSRPVSAVSLQKAYFLGGGHAGFLFTLERHPSPLDGETGVRPYVYEAGPRGLIARWRGSGLAWPLVDATVLPGPSSLLCALHRNDSFLVLNPSAPARRTAVYRWNGFGFSGVEDTESREACRAALGLPM